MFATDPKEQMDAVVTPDDRTNVEVVHEIPVHVPVQAQAPQRPFDKFNINKALWEACTVNDAKAASEMIETTRVNVNYFDPTSKKSCMFRACGFGSYECVKLLLLTDKGGGVDVNKTSDKGLTPLMVACIKNRYKVVELLLQSQRVDLLPKCNGLTALGYAYMHNNVETIRVLVNNPRMKEEMRVFDWKSFVNAIEKSDAALYNQFGASTGRAVADTVPPRPVYDGEPN